MEINYNVSVEKRKELVKVISETTGAKAEYQFMPTCSYVIDYFTVMRFSMTAPTARKSRRFSKPSPPQVSPVSPSVGLTKKPANYPKNRQQRRTARLSPLRWKSRRTRSTWTISQSCWRRRAALSKRLSEWTLFRLRLARTGFPSRGSAKSIPTRRRRSSTSSPRSAR